MSHHHRRAFRAGNRFQPTLLTLEGRCLLTADFLTYHGDNARTSANLLETTLTPSNVNPADFGRVGFLGVDAKVDAQPLYKSGVAIPGQGTHNVLYVATEGDSVYAFDADNGALLWRDGPRDGSQALLDPGETTVPATDFPCDQVAPTIGITSTPVIDPATNTLYVVAMSKGPVTESPFYYQRIHALDLGTGRDKVAPHSIDSSIRFPGKAPGSDGTNLTFVPGRYDERDALTLVNGVIYTAWASHCDLAPYTGWVIGFHANDLSLASVLNINPNGTPAASNNVGRSGNSFWNSGAGFAADNAGNLFNISANGPFDPNVGDFGDAYLRFSTANGLKVSDYFAPSDQQQLSDSDTDVGSSGILLLPDVKDASGRTLQLAVGSGKNGTIYVVDRNDLGKFNATTDRIHQEIAGALGGALFGSPAYFNGRVYFGGVGASLRSFSMTDGRLSTAATSQSPETFSYPGTSPTISANGTSSAIVWAAENGSTAALHAYDATNLAIELYNSNQAANGRDHFGAGNKFITPTVVNGKVYVGTTNGVAVFGLLAPITPPPPPPPPPSPPGVLIPAFSAPSPVVGGLDLLGAVGSDSTFGEPALTYTWSAVATPSGAPTPSFSGNGTNASKLVAVGIAAPGLYTIRVTIADPQGRVATSDVTINVTLPVPTIVIPAFASRAVRGSGLLAVVGTDQAFAESALTYTWSAVAVPRGASSPVFRTNGTNGSKLVAYSVSRAGTYRFRVVVANPFGQSAVSEVTVVVSPPIRRR